MKKAQALLLLILMLIGLTGCFTSTFNPLREEDYLIYESDDKFVRLEICMKTSPVGRLYIVQNEVMQSFIIDYIIISENIGVYVNVPELEDNIFNLAVSFKKVNAFKQNYDVMFLKEQTMVEQVNPKHDLFTDFDLTLNRVYDEEAKPLNYFYNKWQTEDETIVFVNKDLNAYYSGAIFGTLNGESVWISFKENTFTIWSKVDLNMKLAGGVTFDGLDIVLEPFEWYTKYPSTITLIFMKIPYV